MVLVLSDEERKFLVEHIKRVRPGEFDFLKHMLRDIDAGANTPTLMFEKVKEYFKAEERGFPKTDPVFWTMRAGSIGKLLELGLITISFENSRSTYKLTSSGVQMTQ